jgi:hypothetical protein
MRETNQIGIHEEITKEKAGGISFSRLSFESSKITMLMARVAQLLEALHDKQTRSWFRFPMGVTGFFSLT